jgi:hypothetical protein
VQARALPAILQPGEIGKARLIKIDVEGSEWQVVTGMTSMRGSCRQDVELVIEMAPAAAQAALGASSQELLEFLARHGFHPYRIEYDYGRAVNMRRGVYSRPKRVREATSDVMNLILSRRDEELLT